MPTFVEPPASGGTDPATATELGSNAVTTALNIGTGAAARTITLGNDASTKVDVNALAIELDAGSNGITLSSVGTLAMDTVGTAAINLGTEAAAKTITIGNDASTKVDVNALAIELDSAGTIVLNSVTTTDIQATGNLTLDSSGGAISIGNDNDDGDINIGTQGERTISIGNQTSGSQVDIKSGTGGIELTTTGVGRITFTSGLDTSDPGQAGQLYTTMGTSLSSFTGQVVCISEG